MRASRVRVIVLCGGGQEESDCTSARVPSDWGTCKFISSPSKSALYGDVTLRFMRKVDQGSTLTRWPIMDILCSVGCRLKMMTSSSCRCRSTTYPGCRFESIEFCAWRKSMRCPSSRIMYLAPGCWSGPWSTYCFSRSMLKLVTRSGTVSVSATDVGTPTCES